MKYCVRLLFCVLLLPCLLSGEEASLVPSSQLYDRYGVPIRSFLSENQTYYRPVDLGQISPWMVLAAVSMEDKRFFSHAGVDFKAVARAAWQNVKAFGVVSGASTITQQLVRSREPRSKDIWGKASEMWDAFWLERDISKEEILEEYFNRLEFGNLTQGVEAAANYYFNTSAAQLSLSQAAFLAGMIKSPSKYNPQRNFNAVLKRRNAVLKSMLSNEFITREHYEIALNEAITLQYAARPFSAPHFARYVYGRLSDTEPDVYTTLDKDLQLYSERVVKQHLSNLKENNVTNAAVLVLDNQTGAVLAYVGSADFYNTKNSGEVDGVRARRQPGSALKPFVYAMGLERGITPATIISDEDTFFEGGFRPRNYDESFHGPVSVRQALACSYNVPAVKVAEQIGTIQMLSTLRSLGMRSLSREADFYGLGLSLGNGEVNLLELTNAYAALARGGMYKPVVFTSKPGLTEGENPHRVFKEEAAYLIADILADNSARSAAFGLNSPLTLPFPLAAKTGTSKDYKDNFTVGYTPRWTIGVWVGNFDASPMEKVSGISGAAPIMRDVALYLQQKYPSPAFTKPDAVVSAPVCIVSGQLAGSHCAHVREEVFIKDKMPQEVCSGTHETFSNNELQIIVPQAGDVYYFDPAFPPASQQLKFSAVPSESKGLVWKLNGERLPGETSVIWWRIKPGNYILECSYQGHVKKVSFKVL